MNLRTILFSQYPALILLAVLFLIAHLRVRKTSAVKSVLWGILFGAALAAANHARIEAMREGRLGTISGFPARLLSGMVSPSRSASSFERDIIATHGPRPTVMPSRCSVS